MKQKRELLLLGGVGALVVIAGVVFVVATKSNQNTKPDMSHAQHQSSPASEESKYKNLKGDAFDEAYIADMLAHHEGAVSMAEQAQAATSREEIRALAGNIVQSQSQEIVKMRAWQRDWGYKITASGGHGSHGGSEMAGEMDNMQESLKELEGTAYDKEFLKQMILHHQQALDMSGYVAANAKHRELKDLALDIAAAQKHEIEQMKQWQREWKF